MRTRLDEIVEEEMRLAGWQPMPDSVVPSPTAQDRRK